MGLGHEALSEKWEITIDLPIVIEKILPNIKVNFQISPKKNISLPSNKIVINDLDIYQEYFKLWNGSRAIDLISKNNLYKILKIKEPYFVRDINTKEKLYLDKLELGLSYNRRYYYGNLRELKNTLLIKDILNNKIKTIYKQSDLINFEDKFKEYFCLEQIP